MPNNNDIVRAIGDAIVQAAEYINRDANDYSKSSIKNARINGNQIKQNSVPGFVLKDGSIPGLKIVDLDFAKIKNVEIGNAHIANAGIDYAKIKDLHADSAYFGSNIFELGVGDELYLGRLRVNAANIAHLEVGELILESPDGTLYRLGVDEDGNVVTSVYEVQYQNIADMTKNLMSQYTIYRSATAPETPYVDQLWVNTDTDITKRCIAVTPEVIWEPVKASELHTSFINAIERGLEILSTGVIEVKNGGNIDIQSGGSLNIRTSGNMIVEAGGQIQLQSSDAITIGGYPMDVGGANLLIDTSTESRETTFSSWQSPALHDITDEGIDLLKNGGRFTVKARIKNLSGLEDIRVGVHLVRSGTPAYTQYNASSYITPGGEGDSVLTFTAPADANIIAGYVWLRHDASDSGTSTASYSRFKLETGNVPTAWSPSEFDTSAALESLNSEIMAQIDGKVEMWYYNGVPLTTNAPASLWTTTELKGKHIGDLYYDLDTGIAYRYKTAPYEWEIVRDAGITQALEEVSTAQTTADGKMQVYTGAATPVAPYDIGDLWVVTGEDGFVKVSTRKRDTTGYTNASDWTLSGTDTKADTAIDELTDIASDDKLTPVEKQFVKKEWDTITGEYPKIKAEAESYGLTAHAAYIGYTHTTTGKYKLLNDYITPLLSNLTTTTSITGSVLRSTFKAYYDARQDLLNAITTKARTNLADFIDDVYEPAINTKNRIWYQPGVPTSSAVNDIWYDTDADPVKIYRANAVGVSSIVTSGNGWYDITSVALDQALKDLNSLGSGSYHFFQSDTRPKSAGESGGSQINIGDIWFYTGPNREEKYVNGATYRAVSTNPTTDSGWLAFVAGAVLTPHIALDANHLTLSGESDLTIANPLGGNAIVMDKNGVVIESGSDLTIKDGYGGNVINMDNTGMTLSSTGQLKLQSADSIIIGGSPFSVGGTNLLKASDTVISNNQYGTHTYTPTEPMIAGEKYTISMMVTPAAKVTHFTPYVSGGYNSLVILSVSGTSKQLVRGTFTASYTSGRTPSDNIANADVTIYRFPNNGTVTANSTIHWIKLEKGTMATDWSPHSSDPASGVKTSSVEVNSNGIYMDTTGTFNVNAGVGVNILGGTGSTSIGVSNNKTVGTDKYFLWAGNAAPASAPFSVKMDGSVKATKIQHEMPYTFWDMADGSAPAEFPIYIPSGYAIDSVSFTFQTKKARTFAKGAASAGGGVKTSRTGGGVTTTSDGIGTLQTGNTALTTDTPNVASTGNSGTGSTSAVSPGATSGLLNAVNTGKPSANNTASATPGATGDSGTGSTSKAAPLTGEPSKTSTGSTTPGSTGSSSVSVSGATGYKTAEGSHNHAVGTLAGGSHSHTSASHSHTLNAHTHLVNSHSHSGPSHSHTSAAHSHGPGEHIHSVGDHTHAFSGTHSHTGPSHSHTLSHTHDIQNHNHLLTSHTHSVTISGHTHIVDIDAHTHGLDYGINEKATLATSCALKVGATTIGTYSPNPSNPVEIKTYLSTGWNTVIVAPNNDARIVAFALVKLTPA